jgi:flagellar basal-body rod modification protein FlgD
MIPPVSTSAQTGGPTAPAAAQSSFTKGTDFTVFLKMLTTQMQNQNPLNPVEAADFAVQLATFSGVEQQVQTNQLLSRLTERMIGDDFGSWLDSDVATSDTVTVSDTSLRLGLPPAATGATRQDFVLTSPSGAEVLRLPLMPGQQELLLDVSAAGASPVLPGTYSAQVQSFRGQEQLSSAPVQEFARVTEVRRGPDGLTLVLANGTTARPADITSIRSR